MAARVRRRRHRGYIYRQQPHAPQDPFQVRRLPQEELLVGVVVATGTLIVIQVRITGMEKRLLLQQFLALSHFRRCSWSLGTKPQSRVDCVQSAEENILCGSFDHSALLYSCECNNKTFNCPQDYDDLADKLVIHEPVSSIRIKFCGLDDAGGRI